MFWLTKYLDKSVPDFGIHPDANDWVEAGVEEGQDVDDGEGVGFRAARHVEVHHPENVEGKPAHRVAQHNHNQHLDHLKGRTKNKQHGTIVL